MLFFENDNRLARAALIAVAVISSLISAGLWLSASAQILLSPNYADVSEMQKLILVASISCTGLSWYTAFRPPRGKGGFWLAAALASVMLVIILVETNLPGA